MALNLKIINPIKFANWDKYALAAAGTSIFHTAAWARVLHDSYNYRPLYFTQMSKDRFKTLVPLMEVNSFITGRRGVSLPFTDACDLIIDEDIGFEKVLEQIIEYGKSSGWRYIEFRAGHNGLDKIKASKTYFSHLLELDAGAESIHSQLRSSTKRNIKKAIKEGVEIQICNSANAIKDFCRLNCLTRKHHGLPPQPRHFFKMVHQHIISKQKGFIVHALYNGKIISSCVYFLFGRKAVYKWGASDREFNHLRANNLVMWKAIEYCSGNGIKSFDFGRTAQENKGLLQFKRGWRGKETSIHYFKYDFIKKSFVREHSNFENSYKIFSNMPIFILRFAGNMLYRHVG